MHKTSPTTMLLSEEERVAADILLKDVEKKAIFEFEGDGTKTLGLAWNNHKDWKDLLLLENYNWSKGPVMYSYPDVIYSSKRGQPAYFNHAAPLPIGSKAGVVYADGNDSTARKWLVAFNSVNNKVYVEAGPIGPTDWNVVDVKLTASGSTSEYEDPVFHGKASAEIRPDSGITLVFVRFTN